MQIGGDLIKVVSIKKANENKTISTWKNHQSAWQKSFNRRPAHRRQIGSYTDVVAKEIKVT